MLGSKRLKETGLVIGWANVGRFGIVDVRYLYIDVCTSGRPSRNVACGVGHRHWKSQHRQVTPQSIGRDSINDLPETSRLVDTNPLGALSKYHVRPMRTGSMCGLDRAGRGRV